MKKVIMMLAALALAAVMIVPASAAEVAIPMEYKSETSEGILGTPVMAFSLWEMDQMAAEAGYTIAEPVAENVIRMYTACVENITYNVTLYEQMVTKCSHQDNSEIGGAIYAMPLYADENLVATEFDPKTTLFNDVISMDAVEAKLVEAGYSIGEPAPGVAQYLKGNDTEGSNITVISDTVRVYNYGDNYSELVEYIIADNTVPMAMLAVVK